MKPKLFAKKNSCELLQTILFSSANPEAYIVFQSEGKEKIPKPEEEEEKDENKPTGPDDPGSGSCR